MAIFKCKMCGGTLEINGNETTTECEYCGTKQTLPRLDDERKANLYDRANHFRRNNEFDKAMSIYENILNEDTSDAEAYWSLVLCRYGIEYVEDPASHKRIPTVNRAQFTSIFDDINYKSAMKYADITQKSIYEAEANVINDIQKGILEISRKEEPFDVFICYKESDANGRRTPDSVLANDLYHQLVNEGYKVFFSRITLEDKLGIAYEPYIFAALNSAKVMVVLGTKPEYFNAIWVKNEWSRYLSLVKESNGKKLLIPAYKDMDPYDLPEEFSHLQAQDMSKLGFMQDLIRGIKKLVGTDVDSSSGNATENTEGVRNSIAPLLKRAFMYLEDGEWKLANEYGERVLDQDPENADAYLVKMLADLTCRTKSKLKDYPRVFEGNNNYKKVMRFGTEELCAELQSYNKGIAERLEKERQKKLLAEQKAEKQRLLAEQKAVKQRLLAEQEAEKERRYHDAVDTMESSISEYAFLKAAEKFGEMSGYRDADVLQQECLEKAEVARKDAILKVAEHKMEAMMVEEYTAAIRMLETISDWKDATEKIELCKEKIAEIQAKEEAERLEKERQEEIRRQEKERKKKRNKIIAVIAGGVFIWAVIMNTIIIPNNILGAGYSVAIVLKQNGEYEKAIEAFMKLDGYKDSNEQIQYCRDAMSEDYYYNAITLYEEGEYDEFLKLINYVEFHEKDEEKIQKIHYLQGEVLLKQKEYDKACRVFQELGGYSNAEVMLKESKYQKAENYLEKNKFDLAIVIYKEIGDYKDSKDKIKKAEILKAAGE